MIPSKEKIFLSNSLYHGICLETRWCYLCYLFYIDEQLLTNILFYIAYVREVWYCRSEMCERTCSFFSPWEQCWMLLSMQFLSCWSLGVVWSWCVEHTPLRWAQAHSYVDRVLCQCGHAVALCLWQDRTANKQVLVTSVLDQCKLWPAHAASRFCQTLNNSPY